MPEIVKWISQEKIEYADFNNCVYADPAKGEQPYRKPQRFVGKLSGLASLSGRCQCSRGVEHPRVVGANAAKDSAAYPIALCHQYAKLVVETWLKDRRQPGKRAAEPEITEKPDIIEEAHWSGGQGAFGSLRVQDTKKARRDRENKEAIGGMRRPVWALEHVPGLRTVGQEVSRIFDKFAAKFQGAALAGEHYGMDGFKMTYVDEWKSELDTHFRVCSERPALLLKSLLHYDTPVHVALLEAWTQQAKDPDQMVIEWLKHGAPLGANMGIPSVGIFPPKGENPEAWEEAKAETQAWETRQNYRSFTSNPLDSNQEMGRLMGLGYVKKISEEQATNYFSGAVVSKLGLLMKPKADGTVKRRIVFVRSVQGRTRGPGVPSASSCHVRRTYTPWRPTSKHMSRNFWSGTGQSRSQPRSGARSSSQPT